MILLQNVSFSYESNQHKVFDNLNLQIETSSWAIIAGPDGSGKTTLGKLIKGLLVPDSGLIRIGVSSDDVVNAVGYLGGDPAEAAVGMTVEEDVVFGLENMGLEPNEIDERLHDALMRTGLVEMSRRLVHSLSGGEQQKLALAGLLAMKIKVLIIDEALAMLDKPVRKTIRSLVSSLRYDTGLTIIEMTNNFDDVSLADRVIFLSKGAITFDGTPEGFLSSCSGKHWSSINGGFHALCTALHNQGLITRDRKQMRCVPHILHVIDKMKRQLIK